MDCGILVWGLLGSLSLLQPNPLYPRFEGCGSEYLRYRHFCPDSSSTSLWPVMLCPRVLRLRGGIIANVSGGLSVPQVPICSAW